MKKITKWDEAAALCDSLSEDQDTLTREIVTRLADKWTLWVMSVLAEAGEPLRFSRVLEQVEGVSQKSLTKTLRQLERDGLVTRKMFAEVPPRVEYAITPIGVEMLEHVEPLWSWVAKSVGRFQQARIVFDTAKDSREDSL
ncbi:helix-turn-helix domain-containing protein [Granulicella sp. S156]|jgi:DNA-binding HxlR family transcriptional regulator|uniref:winged helix-turn-helix transcriptional regulator n=1 Tax=Granulicella sp. S156 TaxID=1747224 RepID=UPI00131B6E35|nr:helix-turn-helix domain-containing protein [Granulicella sp. S156]